MAIAVGFDRYIQVAVFILWFGVLFFYTSFFVHRSQHNAIAPPKNAHLTTTQASKWAKGF